eukprot:COSAG06_NODE_26025_length_623_cov_1.379771_2_plen_20_part_01
MQVRLHDDTLRADVGGFAIV